MGSAGHGDEELPVHQVTLASGFWMTATEVTQAQYQALVGSNPSSVVGIDNPVENVNWDNTQAFLANANAQDPGKDYRLPSEAEWEYACRAGTNTAYYTGDAEGDLAGACWYDANSGAAPHIVAGKAANAWGLFDMSGNVWEWCEDYFHINYDGAPNDGSAWVNPADQFRVMRGGSWANNANNARSAYRSGTFPDAADASGTFGFRFVAKQ
jgi:formylglycine-generating enzyme required for sulfatase activity